MNTQLYETIRHIVSRTILASDESTATITQKFVSVGIESTPESRRKYRQLLFETAGVEKYISGVIMYDETIRQATDDGTPFPQLLADKDILPGIKVDKGTQVVSTLGIDTYTQGCDGLTQRLEEYYELGARFAKWRAVYRIDRNHPTTTIIERNAHDLALYALLCQHANIAPIVEPEVLMDGDHSLEEHRTVTDKVLREVFKNLRAYGVDLKGIILKPNMITGGSKQTKPPSVEEVSTATLETLKENVPDEVPAIAFLSGGQSPDMATAHLDSINKIKRRNPSVYPWRITSSFLRASQGEALETWAGIQANTAKAQNIFISRANKVYKASLGEL